MEEIVRSEEEVLSEYILHSLKVICKYLGIETRLLRSSDIPKDNGLKGQDKILEICSNLGAEEYYNAIGEEIYIPLKRSVHGISDWDLSKRAISDTGSLEMIL